MVRLYDADRLRQAEALLDRSERFIGLETRGADMQGSVTHRTSLPACNKLLVPSAGLTA